jgi:capsular exopolysaccharide synthesis family protein
MKETEQKAQLLRRRFKDVLEQTISANENRLRILEEEHAELESLYEAERSTALELAKEAFTFTHLKNAVERHRKLFDALVQRMLEVDISSGFAKASVQLIEKADEPNAPVNSRRMRKVGMMLAMGLFAGVGLAFFLENLDDSVKTPEDLRERLRVPLLGFVPEVPIRKKDVTADVSPASYRGTLSATEPMSSMTEAFRNIRTSLFYSTPAGEVKSIAITSCSPAEGKTTVSTNLAIVIAQSGKRVLLIDCDLHRPSVNRVMGLNSEAGLTSVLVGEVGWRDTLREFGVDGSAVANLHVMTAGPDSPNPAELLGSRAMIELIAEARSHYDWVILDTPPVLFVSDSTIVSALSDAVLLVVRAGTGHRSLLNRAREQLETVQSHILGAVLNGMSVSRVGRHYSNYYYHGYARYARDYQRSYYGSKPAEDESPRDGESA